MFGILKNITKAAVRTALLPVSAAVDTVTMHGMLTGNDKDGLFPVTGKNLKAIAEDLGKAMDNEEE